MARINIEDDLFKKRAWFKYLMLVQDEDKALGALIRAFMVAQKYWYPDKLNIPEDVWKSECLNDHLITSGLAERTKSGIYVKGTKGQFEWLFKQRSNGKKGGRPKQLLHEDQNPRDTHGVPTETHGVPVETHRVPNQTQLNPIKPSISSSNSISNSSSSSNSLISFPTETTAPKKNRRTGSGKKANFLIKTYCDLWKERHGDGTDYPDIVSKDAGIAKRLAKDLSEKRIEELLHAYFSMPEGNLIKRKHPLELMEFNLKEISAFAKTGKFTTRSEARSIDSTAGVASQLERIRRGEL